MRHDTFVRTPPDSPTHNPASTQTHNNVSTPSGHAIFNGNGSPSKHISQLMELNCSVGKGRRKITQSSSNDNGSVESSASMPSLSHQQQQFFRSKVDERVSANGGNREPFLIGVAGGTASGKSTVCNLIMNSLQEKRVVLLAQDSFYRPLTEEERKNVKQYNFDHPDAIEWPLIVKTLKDLLLRRNVKVPVYDFVTHSRKEGVDINIEPGDVIIIEGILVLAMEAVRDLCHMKIFVDTDDDLRLARRMKRDTLERGRQVDGVILQYTTFVKPMFEAYVSPSKRNADIIIPWAGGQNSVAIDLIAKHIRTKLGQTDLRRIYPNLVVLPPHFQIRGMHTIIRDRTVSRSDFVFYSDRIIRLVVEHALGYLPFKEHQIETPTGETYRGVSFYSKICGVSMIRSGEAMENALRACCKGIKIGKILVKRRDKDGLGSDLLRRESPPFEENIDDIDSDEDDLDLSKLPDVLYQKLPFDISERYVLLLDPLLATGYSAMAAINTLKAGGVLEERILFVSVIASTQGVHQLCTKFPKMKIITSEVDAGLSDDNRVLPGVGEFGDRYFGTEKEDSEFVGSPSKFE
mmetsp:Transcript_6581/g.19659  ORF Transcript_6581/g.19659 Transcript_6581/m.19659 type:complete len:576 (+) Transcript_6581:146-1873(+)